MKTIIPPSAPDHSSNLLASLPAPHPLARRSFLRSLGLGAALLLPGASALAHSRRAPQPLPKVTPPKPKHDDDALTRGDVAILQFLAAAELLETDLWQQYTELAIGNAPYANALGQLDEDMPQYIADNTDDELSHATFLNAFLRSRGAQGVNLDAFRTLPSSQATGASQTGRLTNLMNLTVDTSWWT